MAVNPHDLLRAIPGSTTELDRIEDNLWRNLHACEDRLWRLTARRQRLTGRFVPERRAILDFQIRRQRRKLALVSQHVSDFLFRRYGLVYFL